MSVYIHIFTTTSISHLHAIIIVLVYCAYIIYIYICHILHAYRKKERKNSLPSFCCLSGAFEISSRVIHWNTQQRKPS